MRTKINLLIAATVCFLLIAGAYYFVSLNPAKPGNVQTTDNAEISMQVSISVDPGYKSEAKQYTATITQGVSMLALMQQLAAINNDFTFQTDNSNFGAYVTTINGVQADSSSEFWNLKINGVDSTVGISDLLPQATDNIIFTLTSF